MTWQYLPICVRFKSKRKDTESVGLSGVYLCSPTRHFCLTVSHIPLLDLENYEIYISARPLMSKTHVLWCLGLRGATKPLLSKKNDPLYDYIHHALRSGFNLIPAETFVGTHVLTALNLMTIHCKAIHKDIPQEHFHKFDIDEPAELSRFFLKSFPFTFTSPSMFSEFLSSGSVNCVIRDKENHVHGFLSDVKYLENMAGGLVNSDKGSYGILLGNLRKMNGDGDLLVVVPWQRLIRSSFLSKEFGESAVEATKTETFSPKQAVLSLVIVNKKGESTSWGSCVFLNRTTLLTNAHVVKTFKSKSSIKCRVILNNGEKVPLSDNDKVTIPFEELDLAFISLSPENQKALSTIKPVSVGLSFPHQIAEKVITIGHGLILNEDNPNPILSTGTISSKLSMNPFLHLYSEIPCMLVTSSHCWNGSSGGGLFNKHGQLIGLICSNAQVFLPAVSGDQVAPKTEKISLFCLCIPVELVFECYRTRVLDKTAVELNDKLLRTWNLDNCHEDVYERRLKL